MNGIILQERDVNLKYISNILRLNISSFESSIEFNFRASTFCLSSKKKFRPLLTYPVWVSLALLMNSIFLYLGYSDPAEIWLQKKTFFHFKR